MDGAAPKMAPSDGEISSTESDPEAENDVTISSGDENEQSHEIQSSDLSSLCMDEEHQVHISKTANNDQMSNPESTEEGDINNQNKPTSKVKGLLMRMISCNQVQRIEDKAAAFMQEEGTDEQPSKGSKEDESQKQIQKKGKKILRKNKQDKNMLSMEPSVCDTDSGESNDKVRIKVNQSAVNGDGNQSEKQNLKPPTNDAQPKDEKNHQPNVREYFMNILPCTKGQQDEDASVESEDVEISQRKDSTPVNGRMVRQPSDPVSRVNMKPFENSQKKDTNMLKMAPSESDTSSDELDSEPDIYVNKSIKDDINKPPEKEKLKSTNEAQPHVEKKPKPNVRKYFMSMVPCTKGLKDETDTLEDKDNVELSQGKDSTPVSDTLDRQSSDPVSRVNMKPFENSQKNDTNMLKMAPSESDTSSDELDPEPDIHVKKSNNDDINKPSEKEKLKSTNEAQPHVEKKPKPNVRKYFMSMVPCTKGLKDETDTLEDKDNVELSQLKENQIVCDRSDGQPSEQVNKVNGEALESQLNTDHNKQSDNDGDDQTSNMQKPKPSKDNRHNEQNIPKTRVTKFFMRIVPCTKDQTDVEMAQSESETNIKESDVKFENDENEVNQSDEDDIKQTSDIQKLELTEKAQPDEIKKVQSRAREHFMRIIPCSRGQQDDTKSVDNENDKAIYDLKENSSISEGTNGTSSEQVSTVIIKPLSNPQNKNINLLKMAPSESDEESDTEPGSNANQSHDGDINRLSEIQKLKPTNEKKAKSSVREYMMGILPCHRGKQYMAGSEEYKDNTGLSDLKENPTFTDITAEKSSKRGKKKMKKLKKKASAVNKKEQTNIIKQGPSQCDPNSDDPDTEPENNASDPVEDEVEQASDMESATPTGETQPTKDKTRRSRFREYLMRIFPWNQVEKEVTKTTDCKDKVEEIPPINYRRKQLSARRLSKLNIQPLRNPGNMNPNLLKMAPSESDTSSEESDESDDETPGTTEQPNNGTSQQSRVRKFFMRIAPSLFNNSYSK